MGRRLILLLMLVPAATVRADEWSIDGAIRKYLTVRDGLAIYSSGDKAVSMRAYPLPVQWHIYCGQAGLSVTIGPPDGENSSDIDILESPLVPEQCGAYFPIVNKTMKALIAPADRPAAKP